MIGNICCTGHEKPTDHTQQGPDETGSVILFIGPHGLLELINAFFTPPAVEFFAANLLLSHTMPAGSFLIAPQ